VVKREGGAAGRVRAAQRGFARAGLGAIEESAPAALAARGPVHGLLREDPARTAPQATLKDLGRLLEQTRIAGVELDAEIGPEVERVPAAASAASASASPCCAARWRSRTTSTSTTR